MANRDPEGHLAALDEPRGSELVRLDALIRAVYVQCTTDRRYLADTYAGRLPKANVGKRCVRFKRLSDVDQTVLAELLADAGRSARPRPPLRRAEAPGRC